jgi:hypothetical protein
MTMSRPLPVPKEVKDLFEELLGRPVTVGPADPIRAADLRNQLLVSVFVDPAMKMKAVVGMDLPLTVYSGAAIGLIPAAGAQACVDERDINPMIAENVTEVCNILTSLLNREGLPHLKMNRTFMPGDQPPADAVGYLLALGRRLDLMVDVQGYGSGRFTIALAN